VRQQRDRHGAIHSRVQLDKATCWINTARVTPRQAAVAIQDPDLIVWYDIMERLQVGTRDGLPAADNYGNVQFQGSGRTRAHAGRPGEPPPCLPDREGALESGDLWALMVGRVERCVECAHKHQLP
jgi:hypothetical protein